MSSRDSGPPGIDGQESDFSAGTFSDTQYDQVMPDGVQFHYWHLARNRFIEKLLLRSPQPKQRNILEIGCGRGAVLAHLRAAGFQATGCELALAEPLVEEIRPHLMAPQDALELDHERATAVDTVLLLDVLEHIREAPEFLGQCRRHFSSADTFLVTLPARQELYSNFDRHFGHHLRYDPDSVKRLARSSGFDVSDWGYFFHLLYPAIGILGALSKKRSVEMSSPSGLARLGHRAISAVLSFESRVIPKRVVGSSIYALLRPSRA